MPRTKQATKKPDSGFGTGLGSQAWPELREPVATLTYDDPTNGDEQEAKALLFIVHEFKRRKDSSIDIEDLCSALEICVYQESIRCEKAAYQFANES